MKHLFEFRLFEDARAIGDRLGVDWARVSLDQLEKGMRVEMEEHGSGHPDTDVIGSDPVKAAKIALAHLREIPDYYDRLKDMEAGAEKPNEALRSAFGRYEAVTEGFSERKSRADREYLRIKRDLPGLALTLLDGNESYLVKLGQTEVVQYFKNSGTVNAFGMNVSKTPIEDVSAAMDRMLGRSVGQAAKSRLLKGAVALAQALGVRAMK